MRLVTVEDGVTPVPEAEQVAVLQLGEVEPRDRVLRVCDEVEPDLVVA